MTPFGLAFCALAFVIFGGAVVHRAAREQGRNEIGWTAAIVLASALAVACGTQLVRQFTRRTEELWMLTLPLPLLAGVAALGVHADSPGARARANRSDGRRMGGR